MKPVIGIRPVIDARQGVYDAVSYTHLTLPTT